MKLVTSDPAYRWYVVQTAPRAEQKAAHNLREAGYRTYLPMMRKDVIHHRSKAVITREFVLLNRYLFVAQPAAGADWYTLRACDGVQCVLGVHGVPMAVSANDVEAFQIAEMDMAFDETHEAQVHRGEVERTYAGELRKRFKRGKPVRVVNGPFGGFAGQVQSVTGRNTIRAMLSILGGLTPVEFAPGDVVPVNAEGEAA